MPKPIGPRNVRVRMHRAVAGNPKLGCRIFQPWIFQTYHCYHLAQALTQARPILQMGCQGLREVTGACSGWRRLDQNSDLLTPAFAVPSMQSGRSFVQSIGTGWVSGSTLVIPDTSSSCLIPWPPWGAYILIPISWRTRA